MVDVAGVGVGRRGRAGVGVVRVDRGGAQAQVARSGDPHGGRRLGRSGVGERPGGDAHRRRARRLGDGEVPTAGASLVVDVAGVGVARRGRAGVGVVRVDRGGAQVQATDATDPHGGRRLGRSGVGERPGGEAHRRRRGCLGDDQHAGDRRGQLVVVVGQCDHRGVDPGVGGQDDRDAFGVNVADGHAGEAGRAGGVGDRLTGSVVGLRQVGGR